jgi:DNA-binding PadR family transcriptional regulator
MVERFDYRDFYSGLIRLHVLHHAAKGAIFGLGMIEELGRHGYQISPGTLYPLLHGLEKKGYLKGAVVRDGKSLRKVYPRHAARTESIGIGQGKGSRTVLGIG